VKRQECKKA